MTLKIIQVGDPCLRQIARPLTLEEINSDNIQELILSMQQTMYNAPGVGLAAPQIGESLQLIVIEDREQYHQALTTDQLIERERVPVPFHVIINPELKIHDDEKKVFHEGCLSFAGFVGLVPRFRNVTVSGLNQHGEIISIRATGWYARILQHEVDHLNGCLCIDRMILQSLTTIENYKNFWKDANTDQATQLNQLCIS